jgi:PucR C-terminal helix-turn-helix domain
LWPDHNGLGQSLASVPNDAQPCPRDRSGHKSTHLGPALAGLPSLWGVSLAIAILGGGLVLLSSLSANDYLPAAPAFACAASVLFWWFATGLDNYVPGAAGPHTVAALGLALTKHPLAAGTGALGGLLSTPWPWVAFSVWVSLLYIHVNTAHHRLARIEEKTGCDLRDLADVQELLIAIRLTGARS